MKTLEIKGKELRYLDIGHGFPILFGHSYLWDHKMWAPQIHHLSKSYRCIVPDLWGHGQSDALPRENNDLSDIADDMMTLMRHLKLDDQFAIIGLSVGGMWAAELAYKHPLSIKSIVLMNTFLGEEPPANGRICDLWVVMKPLLTRLHKPFFQYLPIAQPCKKTV
ncbi:hypothetical protein GCM10010995_28310 [Cysteiniphilum litorale]|uniref:AB hydrolase-1 domain-containing protein n=2 Tax=Cysteiniphilum litorale TaxID=2056700 RepID=A0A8J3EBI3_9GAMM|nr:alpha/beta hydrolase [Cysteiniphilum sp. SYW-8]GGG09054.1 hypothetical protein GCM10010995_28310 [Cysteiniphilum litorale]